MIEGFDQARAEAWSVAALERARALDGSADWLTAHDDPGGRVEWLRSRGAAPDLVRGELRLRGDHEELVRVLLTDRESHKRWDPSLSRFVVHADLGGVHQLVQLDVRTGAHPLVRNRELLIHEATIRDGDTTSTIAASREFPAIPVFPGHLRAKLGVAWRRLEPVGEGVFLYRALWETELGGLVPKPMVTRGQVSAMRAELLKFAAWWPVGA